jgi:hypothetical protein
MSRYNLLGIRRMYPGMFLNPPTIETRHFGKVYVSQYIKDRVDFSKKKLEKVN